MSNNTKYTLDKETANGLLNNVLDSCNIPPSSDSLNERMLKSSLERKPIVFFKALAVFCMIVAIISPLAFKADETFSLVKKSNNVAISSHILYENCFILTLTGDVDYTDVKAKKNDGAIIFPDQIDETTGLVIFPYDGDALNIYIKARNGGYIQAVLNEKK